MELKQKQANRKMNSLPMKKKELMANKNNISNIYPHLQNQTRFTFLILGYTVLKIVSIFYKSVGT